MSKNTGTAYLVLENGRIFKGRFFGADIPAKTQNAGQSSAVAADITGELVFTTSMTGYLETLTDNSYFGQIVLQTFPMIGNYGIISEDFESDSVRAGAYIVNSWCEEPSNFRSEGNLDAFLKAKNITGLCGIDTREVTKIIRENGVMNAKITDDEDYINNIDFDGIKKYRITNAVETVSCKEIKELKSESGKYKVALFDFGVKESLKRELLKRGCDVWVVPHNTAPEQIKQINPDGVILSSGPGDPADNENAGIINSLKEIVSLSIPIFGIGLGHQLLALAHGFRTKKLKYGHRGANQPVKDLRAGTVYITNQNHGYTVAPESIDGGTAAVMFENVNDKTCEGIIYKNARIFSSEFYPEAFGGTRDTGFLFDMFTENMDSV